MNNKGFTTVELILTLFIVITIMATISSVTYTYRDESNYEELVTEVIDFKNTVTKTIYDDILNKNYNIVKIIQDEDNDKKFYLVDSDNNNIKTLEIVIINNKVGINYDGIDYLIENTEFDGYTLYPIDNQEESDIYGLDIYFQHNYMEDRFKIHFIIS